LNQNIRYYRRRAPRITLVLGMVLVIGTQAHADVVGRLHLSVKNASDEKPLIKATITLKDSAGVRPPINLTVGADGTVITPAIEARPWTVVTKGEDFETDTRSVTVVADTTTEVEVLLEPLKEKVIKITGTKNLTRPSDVSQGINRDQSYNQKFPNTVTNKQSLSQFLQSTPGLALDSVGQAHPLGEHAATTIYLNGFQLPGAFQGRAGQVLNPTAVQNVDVMTGGFAPEYGRETAAILNITLRSGTVTPFGAYTVSGGSFGTFEGGLTAGGQLGVEYGPADENGLRAKNFGYLVDFNARTTQNALESPQPNNQTAHNAGRDYTSFGNFDWHLGSHDQLSLSLADNPATTEVANRTGLPGYPGGGYGFLGSDPKSFGLPSQEQAGQDIYQQDHNEFGVLNYRHDVDNRTQIMASVGLIHTGIDILNNNPAILGVLPTDSSLEYNPTLIRNARDAQAQMSINHTEGAHTIKAGFLIDRQTGLESYSLGAQSQLALDYLVANLPQLAPSGHTTGKMDAQGNPIFVATGATPTVSVNRSGYYNAAYLQDTWRLTKKLTANYGGRLDVFTSDQTTSSTDSSNTPTTTAHVGLQTFSPRINLAYALDPRTVIRTDWDRLTITPPTAQGAAVGSVIQPETLSQYDLSIEHQTGPGQSVMVRGFYKHIQNQLDVGLLLPGTQIGAFVTDNILRDEVHGVLVSYNISPVKAYGPSAYVSYQYALAKPGGPGADAFNDHDQLHTLSTGANYLLKTGESFGVVFNFGSGFASSPVVDGGSRAVHREINLRASSAPNLLGKGVQATIEVENLFDQRDLMNFNSGFSGTRFQMGRRVVFSLGGKF